MIAAAQLVRLPAPGGAARWARTLAARAARAQVFRALTSRNQLAPLTRPSLARRPDLVGSWEGGSNMILVRPPWRLVPGSCRSLLLNPLRERGLRGAPADGLRRALRTRAMGSVCVANLHASAGGGCRPSASCEARPGRDRRGPVTPRSCSAATSTCGPRRPPSCSRSSSGSSASLLHGAGRHRPPAGARPGVVGPAAAWPAQRREIEVPWRGGTRLIRLSDHAPVDATFRR